MNTIQSDLYLAFPHIFNQMIKSPANCFIEYPSGTSVRTFNIKLNEVIIHAKYFFQELAQYLEVYLNRAYSPVKYKVVIIY